MSEQSQYQTRTPKVDALERLRVVFTDEQLVMVSDLLLRMQARAVERGCDQSVTIVFNGKGLPRHFNGSDNVTAPYKGYAPE